jgi:hypothetical protein
MKQSQENITAMFEATLKFLDQHDTLWSSKPAFAEAVSEAKKAFRLSAKERPLRKILPSG